MLWGGSLLFFMTGKEKNCNQTNLGCLEGQHVSFLYTPLTSFAGGINIKIIEYFSLQNQLAELLKGLF